MDQDDTGTDNPLAPEGASTTNENKADTANKTTVEPVTPTPPIVDPATPPSTPPTEPKKPKALIATTIILAILAIAGVAFGIYGMFFQPKPTCETNCTNTDNNTTAETNDNNAATTTNDDTAEQDVRDTVQKLFETTETDTSSKYRKTYDDYLFMKVDGAKSLLPAEKSYGLFVHFSDYDNIDSEAQQNKFIDTLSQLGFVKNEGIDSSPLINGLNDYINHDNGVVCGFSGVSVTCAHESWVSNETIEFANKLSEAYFAKKESYPYVLNASLISITDSETAPYQTLQVPSDNAVALFYRPSSSDEWQYFTSTQATISCDEFNTSDLKKAFAGNQCHDIATGQQLTVQP